MTRLIYLRRGFVGPSAVALCSMLMAHGASAESGFVPEESKPQSAAASADLRAAVTRGLAAIEKSAARYPEHRSCFSCHHQTLPLLAQVTARGQGFEIPADQVRAQRELTLKSFERRIEELNKGEGIGGRAMTVGYGLWAAALAEEPPEETTEAMVAYLLKTQREEGHWIGQSSRPPLEESYQTCTVLAVQGLRKYARDAQRDAVDAVVTKARKWLQSAPAKSQEDHVTRLWGLRLLNASDEELAAARTAILKAQRSDGGWAQLEEMDSDAYATGQTLYFLQATGLSASDDAYQRGVGFLLKTQRADGNWLVESRSKPVQPYYDFDDEDPLGKNQFISAAATSWAVAALALAADKP